MLWIAPAALSVVALVVLLVGVRSVRKEASRLRADLSALASLREPVKDLRADVVALREGVPVVRGRLRPVRSATEVGREPPVD